MLSVTFSQGNTPFSWKTMIRLGSGPVTGSPPLTSPLVAAWKPPRMFSTVELPQPDGPTRTTNSPRRTSRLMPSITSSGGPPRTTP
jgi:hypothetical protein